MISEARKKIDTVKANPPKAEIIQITPVTPLNAAMIMSEVKSPALKELSAAAINILSRVQKNDVTKEQAILELAAIKQIIQVVVLDWNARKLTQ